VTARSGACLQRRVDHCLKGAFLKALRALLGEIAGRLHPRRFRIPPGLPWPPWPGPMGNMDAVRVVVVVVVVVVGGGAMSIGWWWRGRRCHVRRDQLAVCSEQRGRNPSPNQDNATADADDNRKRDSKSERAHDVPLLEPSCLNDGLRCPARHARIRVVVWQSLERVWQAVAAIPVVDPCRAPSVGKQQ
jgi:hypothetical protein